MPMDAVLVSVAVVSMFAAFAASLIWADLRTRPDRAESNVEIKRRPF
jgi:hypothetical protein